MLKNEDHKRVVTKGIWIIEFVNAPLAANEHPFVLIGDPKSIELKSFLVQSKMYLLQWFLSIMPFKEESKGKLE